MKLPVLQIGLALLVLSRTALGCYYEDWPDICPWGPYCVGDLHGAPCTGTKACWSDEYDDLPGMDGAQFGYPGWRVACAVGQHVIQASTGSASSTTSATQSSTSTKTQAQTVTQVQTYTPVVVVAPQTVTVTSTATNTFADIAEKSGDSQEVSLLGARDVYAAGANKIASQAAVACADAASFMVENSDLSDAAATSCRTRFNKANAMKDAENTAAKRAGAAPSDTFQGDDSVLGSPTARSVFNRFEKDVGVDKNTFLSKLFAEKGNSRFLDDFLKGKGKVLETAKPAAPAAAAPAESPADTKNPIDYGAYRKAFAGHESRGRHLAEMFEPGGGPNSLGAIPQSKENRLGGLTPLKDDLFNGNANDDLSLFDVVHRKYGELRKRIGF